MRSPRPPATNARGRHREDSMPPSRVGRVPLGLISAKKQGAASKQGEMREKGKYGRNMRWGFGAVQFAPLPSPAAQKCHSNLHLPPPKRTSCEKAPPDVSRQGGPSRYAGGPGGAGGPPPPPPPPEASLLVVTYRSTPSSRFAISLALLRPAPMALMTVAAPVTISPPAKTLWMDVSPVSSLASM